MPFVFRTTSLLRFTLGCSALALSIPCWNSLALAQKPPANGGQVRAQTNQPPANAAPKTTQQISAAKGIPQVVGTVNGIPVTKEQLAAACVQRYGTQVLDNILNKSLILQACEAQNIKISQTDVDQEIARIATKFNLSSTLYLKLIEDERNIKPEQYARDIVWPMLALRALARDKIQVPEDLIDQRFQNQYGPTVKVRMVAIEDKGKESVDKMRKLHQQALADPAQFKRIAKENSEDPTSASVEGLLMPIRQFSGDDELERVAFSLKPDQVSNIFKIGPMQVMLQCVRHEDAAPPNPETIPAIRSHIRQTLEDEHLQNMADKLFEGLRKESSLVKVLGDAALQQQYPGVAAILNRQQVPMSMLEEECINRHGATVLEGEMNRVLLESLLQAAKLQVTQADIDQEIASAADRFGYIKPDRTPDVEKWVNSLIEDEGTTLELYIRDAVWPTVALKKLVAGKVQVTEQDLQRGFEANYGPRVEVLAIVLSNQRTAQEVWQMARGKNDDQFFGELAAQYSVEPTSRSNYGKVQPIRKHGIGLALEKAAFDLKQGEMSGIIESDGQFVILRCQGFTKPVVADTNMVREELQKDLYERKTRLVMETYLDEKLKGSDIQNFLDPSKSHAGVVSQAARQNARQTK